VIGVAQTMQGGIFKSIVDEYILLVQGLREIGNFCFLYLPVPLLKDIDEKVKFVVLVEEGVLVELLQLEVGVLLALKQFRDFLLHRLLGVIEQNVLQRGAHVPLFHIEIYI
jgi:hypothetical protein